MAVNLMQFEKELEEFKIKMMDKIRTEINKIKEQMKNEIIKDHERDKKARVRELEKLKLSKNNAQLFLKFIKFIEEVENPRKDPKIIAGKLGIDEEVAEILKDAVMFSKIYEKIKCAKTEIASYL